MKTEVLDMNKRFKELFFIIGIAVIGGYYGLTCFTFILTFLTGNTSVTIHMNLYGELMLEFIVTIISIPFAVYYFYSFRGLCG